MVQNVIKMKQNIKEHFKMKAKYSKHSAVHTPAQKKKQNSIVNTHVHGFPSNRNYSVRKENLSRKLVISFL